VFQNNDPKPIYIIGISARQIEADKTGWFETKTGWFEAKTGWFRPKPDGFRPKPDGKKKI